MLLRSLYPETESSVDISSQYDRASLSLFPLILPFLRQLPALPREVPLHRPAPPAGLCCHQARGRGGRRRRGGEGRRQALRGEGRAGDQGSGG